MTFSGINLLSAAFGNSMEYTVIDELLPLFSDLKKYFCILTVFTLFVPILLLIISGLLHLFYMKKGKMPWWQLLFPLFSIISMGGGWYSVSHLMQGVVDNFIKDMSKMFLAGIGQQQFATHMDVSSFYGDLASDLMGNSIEFKLSGSVGYYLLLAVALILLIEDIILPRLWKEKIRERFILLSGNEKPELPNNIVPDAVYRKENSVKRNVSTGKSERVIQTWSNSAAFEKNPEEASLNHLRNVTVDDPTQRTGQRKGRLIGLRGEYAGAEIVMLNGEKMVLGRSREKCNLILSNPKVSRKHCEVYYDVAEDKYVMVNCSLNGTYLSGGQMLEHGKRYFLPHGTIFRVDKENEFRLL